MRWMSVFVVLLVACGDDDGGGVDAAMDVGPSVDGAMVDAAQSDGSLPPPDAGADSGMDSGLPSECPAGESIADPLTGTPGFAVVGSDYTSTSIAVLNASGDVLAEEWIDSGTMAPGLVASLGGDIVLPAPMAGTLGLLDRFGADVATRVCFDGTLIGQLRLGPAEGFRVNAHDWVVVGPNLAWATRYERNPDMMAAPEEAGNDLLGFDPRTMTLTGDRIDLSDFDAMVTGQNMGSPAEVEVSARPDRAVRVDGHVVVGLDRLPVNLFGDARGHGEGTVVLVADDGTVTSHTLTGLANCGRVQPVAGTSDEVLVTCTGYSDLGFGEPTGERATAGHVRLRIEGGNATEISSWRAADDATSAMAVYGPVSLGGDRLVAVAPGEFDGSVGDRLFVVDLSSGAQTELLEAGAAFVLGDGAYDGDELLLVPDANDGTVRRFTVTASAVTEGTAVPVGPAALPPRSIRMLRP